MADDRRPGADGRGSLVSMSAEPARMTAAAAHQRHVFASTRGRERVSLDVPSGIDATTGETPGVAVLARATLTLALPKTGCGSPAVARVAAHPSQAQPGVT
jgi:NAD(P)H-hydrate repair Nnr-like enzyme with NAD(P)H-hydrate epimerase domain